MKSPNEYNYNMLFWSTGKKIIEKVQEKNLKIQTIVQI